MLISVGLKEFAKVKSLWLCMVFSLRKIFAFSSHTVSEFAWNICEADAVTLSKIFALIFTLLVLMFCKSLWICMNCVCSCCICLLAFSVNVLFHSFPGMIDFSLASSSFEAHHTFKDGFYSSLSTHFVCAWLSALFWISLKKWSAHEHIYQAFFSPLFDHYCPSGISCVMCFKLWCFF